ncbi:MAG: hybrid sensor histidine kinase/response regulator [Deltaproteobacteria bacterium]|nr:hybrid sensor histidine kinase/response regulator [Deltaproteobacteria bacterium]MBW2131506.1 hybrid sensor histidine kinase/response regulator [Deltaproteobacteria bacterium]
MAQEGKQTILLVDDEEDIRDVLRIALSNSGYDVLTAKDGDEALRIFSETRPPIVLTDIKMPGMIDGIELLQRIKRENPDTEVVMITGHGDMDLAIQSLKNEATDFITKPINVEALRVSLQRVEEKILMKKKLMEYTQKLEAMILEKTELRDRLSSLGLMIGSISHGMKGLLTNLDAGLYLLDSGIAKNHKERLQEGLETVRQTTGRIKKLVLDILFYAKERELKIRPSEVVPFAAEVADVIENKIKDKPMELVRKFDRAPKQWNIDPDFLRTALINILENAVDACLEDTEKPFHQITFETLEQDGELVFNIQDNGTGMDSDTLEKAFNLFFSTKGTKGTGFGLFITDNIIKQHGGTIQVKSARGKGTQFCIRIPSPDPDA